MDELEEKQQPSDDSILPAESQDQMEVQEKSTQDQEGGSSDEWDTDLEADDATTRRQSLSRTDLYLQACQQTGTVPVSSFIRQSDKAILNWNHYGVGPRGAKALAIALKNDTVITHLKLEDNSLQAEGIRHLLKMLETNVTIQSLNLSNNQLGFEGAEIISRFLSNNYNIKSIRLSGNDFDDSAAKYLADALRSDYVVKELDLSHNKFCKTGGEHLGDMLETNVGIEELNLSWSQLSKNDAMALCTALEFNSTLKQLHLTHNDFRQIEAKSLGQALKKNSTLVLLDLSSNWIDDEAVALFCQGLASNNTLRVLKLSYNPMTNIGALTLLKTIINMESALEDVDISGVFVHEAFIELLKEAHPRRPALNVQYSAMDFVTKNLSALPIFKKYLEEQNSSIMDFFQSLDKDGTMSIPNSAFRKAVKEANIPLDQRQLEYLVRKFDKKFTATIAYSQFANL